MKKRIFISLLLTILFTLAPFLMFRIEIEQVPAGNSTIQYSEYKDYNEHIEDYDDKYDGYREVNSEGYRHIYNNQSDYERYKEYYEQYEKGYHKSVYDTEINYP